MGLARSCDVTGVGGGISESVGAVSQICDVTGVGGNNLSQWWVG